MKITPKMVKDKLDAAISALTDNIWLFADNPKSDLTKDRKLPADALLRLLLKFGGKSLQSELSANYCSLNVKPDSKDTIAGQRKTDKPDSL